MAVVEIDGSEWKTPGGFQEQQYKGALVGDTIYWWSTDNFGSPHHYDVAESEHRDKFRDDPRFFTIYAPAENVPDGEWEVVEWGEGDQVEQRVWRELMPIIMKSRRASAPSVEWVELDADHGRGLPWIWDHYTNTVYMGTGEGYHYHLVERAGLEVDRTEYPFARVTRDGVIEGAGWDETWEEDLEYFESMGIPIPDAGVLAAISAAAVQGPPRTASEEIEVVNIEAEEGDPLTEDGYPFAYFFDRNTLYVGPLGGLHWRMLNQVGLIEDGRAWVTDSGGYDLSSGRLYEDGGVEFYEDPRDFKIEIVDALQANQDDVYIHKYMKVAGIYDYRWIIDDNGTIHMWPLDDSPHWQMLQKLERDLLVSDIYSVWGGYWGEDTVTITYEPRRFTTEEYQAIQQRVREHAYSQHTAGVLEVDYTPSMKVANVPKGVSNEPESVQDAEPVSSQGSVQFIPINYDDHGGGVPIIYDLESKRAWVGTREGHHFAVIDHLDDVDEDTLMHAERARLDFEGNVVGYYETSLAWLDELAELLNSVDWRSQVEFRGDTETFEDMFGLSWPTVKVASLDWVKWVIAPDGTIVYEEDVEYLHRDIAEDLGHTGYNWYGGYVWLNPTFSQQFGQGETVTVSYMPDGAGDLEEVKQRVYDDWNDRLYVSKLAFLTRVRWVIDGDGEIHFEDRNIYHYEMAQRYFDKPYITGFWGGYVYKETDEVDTEYWPSEYPSDRGGYESVTVPKMREIEQQVLEAWQAERVAESKIARSPYYRWVMEVEGGKAHFWPAPEGTHYYMANQLWGQTPDDGFWGGYVNPDNSSVSVTYAPLSKDLDQWSDQNAWDRATAYIREEVLPQWNQYAEQWGMKTAASWIAKWVNEPNPNHYKFVIDEENKTAYFSDGNRYDVHHIDILRTFDEEAFERMDESGGYDTEYIFGEVEASEDEFEDYWIYPHLAFGIEFIDELANAGASSRTIVSFNDITHMPKVAYTTYRWLYDGRAIHLRDQYTHMHSDIAREVGAYDVFVGEKEGPLALGYVRGDGMVSMYHNDSDKDDEELRAAVLAEWNREILSESRTAESLDNRWLRWIWSERTGLVVFKRSEHIQMAWTLDLHDDNWYGGWLHPDLNRERNIYTDYYPMDKGREDFPAVEQNVWRLVDNNDYERRATADFEHDDFEHDDRWEIWEIRWVAETPVQIYFEEGDERSHLNMVRRIFNTNQDWWTDWNWYGGWIDSDGTNVRVTYWPIEDEKDDRQLTPEEERDWEASVEEAWINQFRPIVSSHDEILEEVVIPIEGGGGWNHHDPPAFYDPINKIMYVADRGGYHARLMFAMLRRNLDATSMEWRVKIGDEYLDMQEYNERAGKVSASGETWIRWVSNNTDGPFFFEDYEDEYPSHFSMSEDCFTKADDGSWWGGWIEDDADGCKVHLSYWPVGIQYPSDEVIDPLKASVQRAWESRGEYTHSNTAKPARPLQHPTRPITSALPPVPPDMPKLRPGVAVRWITTRDGVTHWDKRMEYVAHIPMMIALDIDMDDVIDLGAYYIGYDGSIEHYSLMQYEDWYRDNYGEQPKDASKEGGRGYDDVTSPVLGKGRRASLGRERYSGNSDILAYHVSRDGSHDQTGFDDGGTFVFDSIDEAISFGNGWLEKSPVKYLYEVRIDPALLTPDEEWEAIEEEPNEHAFVYTGPIPASNVRLIDTKVDYDWWKREDFERLASDKPSYSTVFHVAPRSMRADILTNGIDHTKTREDWRANDAEYQDAPYGNYVWDSPEIAFFWQDVSAHKGTHDVWEVMVEPYPWIPDPYSNGAFYTTETIRPEHIWLADYGNFFRDASLGRERVSRDFDILCPFIVYEHNGSLNVAFGERNGYHADIEYEGKAIINGYVDGEGEPREYRYPGDEPKLTPEIVQLIKSASFEQRRGISNSDILATDSRDGLRDIGAWGRGKWIEQRDDILPGLELEGSGSWVMAWLGDTWIATLETRGGKITQVETRPEYRRMGIATALLDTLREKGYRVDHSQTTMTDDGRAWAEAVGSSSRKLANDYVHDLVRKSQPHIGTGPMYHLSDPANHQSIQQYGLNWSGSSVHTEYMPAWANYFFSDKSLMEEFNQRWYNGKADIWVVDTTGLELYADPEFAPVIPAEAWGTDDPWNLSEQEWYDTLQGSGASPAWLTLDIVGPERLRLSKQSGSHKHSSLVGILRESGNFEIVKVPVSGRVDHEDQGIPVIYLPYLDKVLVGKAPSHHWELSQWAQNNLATPKEDRAGWEEWMNMMTVGAEFAEIKDGGTALYVQGMTEPGSLLRWNKITELLGVEGPYGSLRGGPIEGSNKQSNYQSFYLHYKSDTDYTLYVGDEHYLITKKYPDLMHIDEDDLIAGYIGQNGISFAMAEDYDLTEYVETAIEEGNIKHSGGSGWTRWAYDPATENYRYMGWTRWAYDPVSDRAVFEPGNWEGSHYGLMMELMPNGDAGDFEKMWAGWIEGDRVSLPIDYGGTQGDPEEVAKFVEREYSKWFARHGSHNNLSVDNRWSMNPGDDIIFISDGTTIYIGHDKMSHYKLMESLGLDWYDNEYGTAAGLANKRRLDFYDVPDDQLRDYVIALLEEGFIDYDTTVAVPSFNPDRPVRKIIGHAKEASWVSKFLWNRGEDITMVQLYDHHWRVDPDADVIGWWNDDGSIEYYKDDSLTNDDIQDFLDKAEAEFEPTEVIDLDGPKFARRITSALKDYFSYIYIGGPHPQLYATGEDYHYTLIDQNPEIMDEVERQVPQVWGRVSVFYDEGGKPEGLVLDTESDWLYDAVGEGDIDESEYSDYTSDAPMGLINEAGQAIADHFGLPTELGSALWRPRAVTQERTSATQVVEAEDVPLTEGEENWPDGRRPLVYYADHDLLVIGAPGNHHHMVYWWVDDIHGMGDDAYVGEVYNGNLEADGTIAWYGRITEEEEARLSALVNEWNQGDTIGPALAKGDSFHINTIPGPGGSDHVAWLYDPVEQILHVMPNGHHYSLFDAIGAYDYEDVAERGWVLGDIEEKIRMGFPERTITWSREIDEAILEYLARTYNARFAKSAASKWRFAGVFAFTGEELYWDGRTEYHYHFFEDISREHGEDAAQNASYGWVFDNEPTKQLRYTFASVEYWGAKHDTESIRAAFEADLRENPYYDGWEVREATRGEQKTMYQLEDEELDAWNYQAKSAGQMNRWVYDVDGDRVVWGYTHFGCLEKLRIDWREIIPSDDYARRFAGRFVFGWMDEDGPYVFSDWWESDQDPQHREWALDAVRRELARHAGIFDFLKRKKEDGKKVPAYLTSAEEFNPTERYRFAYRPDLGLWIWPYRQAFHLDWMKDKGVPLTWEGDQSYAGGAIEDGHILEYHTPDEALAVEAAMKIEQWTGHEFLFVHQTSGIPQQHINPMQEQWNKSGEGPEEDSLTRVKTTPWRYDGVFGWTGNKLYWGTEYQYHYDVMDAMIDDLGPFDAEGASLGWVFSHSRENKLRFTFASLEYWGKKPTHTVQEIQEAFEARLPGWEVREADPEERKYMFQFDDDGLPADLMQAKRSSDKITWLFDRTGTQNFKSLYHPATDKLYIWEDTRRWERHHFFAINEVLEGSNLDWSSNINPGDYDFIPVIYYGSNVRNIDVAWGDSNQYDEAHAQRATELTQQAVEESKTAGAEPYKEWFGDDAFIFIYDPEHDWVATAPIDWGHIDLLEEMGVEITDEDPYVGDGDYPYVFGWKEHGELNAYDWLAYDAVAVQEAMAEGRMTKKGAMRDYWSDRPSELEWYTSWVYDPTTDTAIFAPEHEISHYTLLEDVVMNEGMELGLWLCDHTYDAEDSTQVTPDGQPRNIVLFDNYSDYGETEGVPVSLASDAAKNALFELARSYGYNPMTLQEYEEWKRVESKFGLPVALSAERWEPQRTPKVEVAAS